MRILFYDWNAFMQKDLIFQLTSLGHTVDKIHYVFHTQDTDPFFEHRFLHRISAFSYDAVMSLNYFPIISRLCNEHQLPYLSWIYDSPSPSMIHIGLPCNHIFFFDKAEYIEYHEKGYGTVHHLPLAVDCGRMNRLLPSDAQTARFSSDISFVGSLYQEEQNMVYQKTRKKRMEILQAASRKHQVKLYAPHVSDTSLLPDIIYQGPVHYYTEMPLVFRLSRININVTMASIRTGIPLRILDIMGAGGFCLTDYQEELEEHFIDGRDLVIYHDQVDFLEKLDYYLSHEEERAAIAAAGQRKVMLFYNYPHLLQQMFSLSGLA